MSSQEMKVILQEFKKIGQRLTKIERSTATDDTVFSISDTADYLGISRQTLYGYRSTNTDPPRLSPRKYLKRDVDIWDAKRDLDKLGVARVAKAKAK